MAPRTGGTCMRQRQPAHSQGRGMRGMRAVTVAAAVTALACSALAAASPTAALAGATTTVHYSAQYYQTNARTMRTMVNTFRTGSDAWWYEDETKTSKHVEENLGELAYDADLEEAAMQRAAEIGLLFSHTRPDGTSCETALGTLASQFAEQGENIAIGYPSAAAAMNALRETDEPFSGQGHRRNMLDPDYNAVGIAHAVVGGQHCWVQEFGKRTEPNSTETAAEETAKTVDVNVTNAATVTCSSLTAAPDSYLFRKAGDSDDLPVATAKKLKMSIEGDSTVGNGLTATVDMTWASAATSIAKVENGKVAAVAAHGETKLTASAFGKQLEAPVSVQPFTDVDPDTPHEADIYWMLDNQITTGFDDGTFRPRASVVRCDMAAFLFRLAKKWGLVNDSWRASSEQQKAFVDVKPGTPHDQEVWWLAANGITTGWERKDGKKEFRPYATVKRQDMAAFLFRLAKLAGKGGASDDWSASDAAKKRFKDVSARDQFNHHREVWWLAQTGISEGWPAGKNKYEFRPLNDIARCDMAAFLHRLYDLS